MRNYSEQGSEIDISGMDKAEVLAALYNAARPLGMGFLQYKPGDMPIEEARKLLADSPYFDYVHGRVMKIRLTSNTLNTRFYDRDNGTGAALRVIDALRRTGKASNIITKAQHLDGLKESAQDANERMNVETPKSTVPGVYNLGLHEQKHHLEPAVKKALGEK